MRFQICKSGNTSYLLFSIAKALEVIDHGDNSDDDDDDNGPLAPAVTRPPIVVETVDSDSQADQDLDGDSMTSLSWGYSIDWANMVRLCEGDCQVPKNVSSTTGRAKLLWSVESQLGCTSATRQSVLA